MSLFGWMDFREERKWGGKETYWDFWLGGFVKGKLVGERERGRERAEEKTITKLLDQNALKCPVYSTLCTVLCRFLSLFAFAFLFQLFFFFGLLFTHLFGLFCWSYLPLCFLLFVCFQTGGFSFCQRGFSYFNQCWIFFF